MAWGVISDPWLSGDSDRRTLLVFGTPVPLVLLRIQGRPQRSETG